MKNELDLEVENINVYKFIEGSLSQYKDSWIDYYGNKISNVKLLEEIEKTSKSLRVKEIEKNDIVTVILPTMVEGIISFLAINKIGAITNFIHPSSSENEIKNAIIETNSKLVISNINCLDKLKSITASYNNFEIIITNKDEYSLSKTKEEDSGITYVSWHDFINESNYNMNDDIEIDKNNVALILYSGGTTGTPKGVMLSNSNIITFIKSATIEQNYLRRGDTILALMPIFHGFGLIHSILFPLSIGMNVVLRDKFNINEYTKMIEEYKPQILMGVPSLFDRLVNEWEECNINLDFLKCILIGGDVLKQNLRKRINKFLKEHNASIKVCTGYGLTECVCGVILGNPLTQKKDYIGIPMPGNEVAIFNENKKMDCNEIGEICINSKTIMVGYYKNEEETKNAFYTDEDGKLWLRTGDIGMIDLEGYVKYIGRLKRIIISSGYNVYPTRIEELIEKHDAIKMCVVVGKKDVKRLEIPKAYIVLNEGFNEFKVIEEIKELCEKNLPKYSWPYEYEILEKMPTTSVGKIDYEKLKRKK